MRCQVDLQDVFLDDPRPVAKALPQRLGQETVDFHQRDPFGGDPGQQQRAQDPRAGTDLQDRPRLRQEGVDDLGGDVLVVQEVLAEFC